MSILHAYIKSGSLSILAKIFNIVSVFGTLYLLNKVLEKTQFGEFFIVFSLITVISLVMGSGAQALTMYHVSRRQEEADAIAGQAFWIFTLISVVVAALLSLFSSLIAELMGNANLQNWLSIMAWFIPPYIATLILPAYWRARQNIAAYLGFNEVLPNVLRLAGLGLIYVQSLPPSYVAIFYVLSVLIPAVIVYGMKPFAPYCKVWYLSKWDWDYMGKITLTQLLNQPFRGIDVVLVGTLTSATIAADYALSAKLVALLLIPKQILGSLQVPRMGALLEKNDRITLLKEFKVMQMLSGAALIIGCFILILFASLPSFAIRSVSIGLSHFADFGSRSLGTHSRRRLGRSHDHARPCRMEFNLRSDFGHYHCGLDCNFRAIDGRRRRSSRGIDWHSDLVCALLVYLEIRG